MFRSIGKKIGLSFLCLFAPLLSAGEPCKVDRSAYGQMVDVGGYKLHLYSIGLGGPAVIIDSGLGGISSDWELVQTGLPNSPRL